MASGQGGELLLVEDHGDTREALAELLAMPGVIVSAVADPEAALARARQTPPPAAVLLDLVMPGIGGLELLRRLKAASETAGVPVLVISGMSAAEREAREAGCHAFLLKPVELATLLQALRGLGIAPATGQ